MTIGEADAPGRMMPELSDQNRAFWAGGADGRLHVPYCGTCSRWVLPPEARCPRCDTTLGTRVVSGVGTVFTYTVNHHAFNPAVPPPHVIAIVQLAEQGDLRLAANVVECEPGSVTVGLPVGVRFEKQDTPDGTVYVPVFAPLSPREAASPDH